MIAKTKEDYMKNCEEYMKNDINCFLRNEEYKESKEKAKHQARRVALCKKEYEEAKTVYDSLIKKIIQKAVIDNAITLPKFKGI